MKWLKKITSPGSSVTYFLMALLLVSSMALREYAHFVDHARPFQGQPGSARTNTDHEAKFHFVTEAELAFETPGWHHKFVGFTQPLSENNTSSPPRLLPETRAPPASV